jgi:sugar/nucleoside kinase (ribokinase family)
MPRRALRLPADAPYRLLTGVGGIGAGLFFALAGDHTLQRNESRPGELLDVRDYCKLHIIAHYVAALLGAQASGSPFRVLPVGRVGDDEAGECLRQEMAAVGMDVRFVSSDPQRPTALSVCFQYPDGAGGNITASNAASSALSCAEVDQVEPYLARWAGRTMALAAPEAPLAARLHLLRLATRYGALRVASLASTEMAAASDLGMFALIDLLAINEDEAAALVGQPFDGDVPLPFLARCAERLTALQPTMRLVVTAGERGAYGYARGQWDFSPALRVPVASTAGAGDALLAGVMVGLAIGLPLIAPDPARAGRSARPVDSALDLGVLLAACTVTSPHTIHPEANAEALVGLAEQLGLCWGAPLAEALRR